MMKDILYPLRRLHGRLYEQKQERTAARALCRKIKSAGHTVFLILTPTHGNLGDHAIAYAEELLLQANHIPFTELTDKDLLCLRRHGLLRKLNGRPILMSGGGYMGTLWFSAEELFRAVMQANPASGILCLPNTVFYEDSDEGRREEARSREIYNAHPSLKLCAREQASFSRMKSLYRDVVLIPDMALSMDRSRQPVSRRGCLLCLRKDLEKTRTAPEEQEIYAAVRSLFGDSYAETDMVAEHGISPEQREEQLERKFEQFRRAELVVTDRLHGMIFSAITGTPCIVLDSKSPKVRGCYEWIRALPYIRFADSPAQIPSLYSQIPPGPHFYQNGPLLPYYQTLVSYISDLIHEVS